MQPLDEGVHNKGEVTMVALLRLDELEAHRLKPCERAAV